MIGVLDRRLAGSRTGQRRDALDPLGQDVATLTETVEVLRQAFVPKWFCLAAGGLMIWAAAVEIASVVRILRVTRRPRQRAVQDGVAGNWTLAARAAELGAGGAVPAGPEEPRHA